jgi:hypothetical protein
MSGLKLHTGPVGRHKRIPLDEEGTLIPEGDIPLYALESGDLLTMEDGSPIVMEAANVE